MTNKTDRSNPGRFLPLIILASASLCTRAIASATELEPGAEPEKVYVLEEFSVVGEQLGYHEAIGSTALGLPIPLIDTPQSVFIINDALIADQQAFRLDQILQNDASVQKRNNFLGAYSSFFIRGFSLDNGANYLRNGRTFFHLASPPVEILDQVEVAKGPSSVLYGYSTPGGIINMTTKKPLQHFGGFIKGTVGTDDLLHAHVDVGGPITKDGSLSYRFNYVEEDSGYFRKFADGSEFEVERQIFFGALRWEPTERTRIDASFDTTNDDRPQDTGIVAIGTGVANIPAERILTQPWSHYNSDVWNFNIDVEQRLSDTFVLRAGYGYQDYERDRYDNQVRTLDEVTGDIQFRARRRINRWSFETLYAEGTYEFDTGDLQHQLLGGIDHTKVEINNNETAANLNFNSNIFNPVVIPNPNIGTDPNPNLGGQDRFGLYAQYILSIGDHWSLIGGLRYDEYKDDFTVAGGATTSSESDNLTPRLGIVYEPSETLSFYVSYSESFEPNPVVSGGFVNDGAQLDPTTGQQYEVGVKSELFDQRLLLSGAAFLAYRSNAPFDDTATNQLVQRGEQTHQGVEFTATGLIGANLSLVASFAYLDAEFTEDDNPAIQGNTPSGVADFSASLWAEYEIPEGFFKNLSLQAGLFYEGERPGDDLNSFTLDSYTRVDAGLKYVWELEKDRLLTTRLTVSNLFDELYYKGDERFGVNPERPREIRLSAQFSF